MCTERGRGAIIVNTNTVRWIEYSVWYDMIWYDIECISLGLTWGGGAADNRCWQSQLLLMCASKSTDNVTAATTTTNSTAACKGVPRQAEVALGVPGRLRPRIFSTFGTRSSAKCIGRLYPSRNPRYSFSEAESTSGHMVLSEGTTEKFQSDTTGDRFRDRPTNSAAP